MRPTHAPRQPHHHIPRPHSHPHTYKTPTTSDLSRALHANDLHNKTRIQTLPDNWSNYNEKGSLITKRQLLQSAWGELKESDSLQAFQQAIITSIPPPANTVTQYTTHLTSAICIDSTLWRHTIRNARQDQLLPHPLFHPTTIFNIHNNSHFTTLITNNHSYYYYDSLDL